MANTSILLAHLERCVLPWDPEYRVPRRAETWAAYVRSRVSEVTIQSARLRRFAGLRPGRVNTLVNARADELDDRVLVITRKLEVIMR